ncbi:unnamed protein product [Urochloa humidicola]
MDGKRTSTLIVIMCLVILSLTGNSAANCDCCVSLQAQICCKACAFAAGDDTICKHTCCFPCTMAESAIFRRAYWLRFWTLLQREESKETISKQKR